MEVPIPRQGGDALEPGSYVLLCPPRGRLSSIFRSLSSSSSDAAERVNKLLSRSPSAEEQGGITTSAAAKLKAASASSPFAGGPASLVNDIPASYSLAGGAALAVRFGLREVAGLGLHHMAPNVHTDPATRSACVFTGHLQNLDELADRYDVGGLEGYGASPTSPSSTLAAGRADPRQLAAQTILRMWQSSRGGDPLVLLSELQGQYAFVLLDGDKRQVFAARDSSGSEPLFYELDEDGAVSLSNAQPPVPSSDDGTVQWSELPPGHFISGRSPRVQQFALTPQQLEIRESYEREMDEEISSPRAIVLLAERQGDEMRRSLSRSLSPDRAGAFAVY